MRPTTLHRIQKVKDFLEQNGPVQADNIAQVSRMVGIPSDYMVRVLSTVRSPWWIDQNGWTIPFVAKGVGTKTYSVEQTAGDTQRLRNGNQYKSAEVETHLRRNLAGLELEARLAQGEERRKAQILATTTQAALSLIDLGT